jgi:hypothetical protein
MTMIWQTNSKRLTVFCQQRSLENPRIERAKDSESALEWCRNKSMSPNDDDFADKFSKIGSIPVSRRYPEDRERDVIDV